MKAYTSLSSSKAALVYKTTELTSNTRHIVQQQHGYYCAAVNVSCVIITQYS